MADIKSQLKKIIREEVEKLLESESFSEAVGECFVTFTTKNYDELSVEVPAGSVDSLDDVVEWALDKFAKNDAAKKEAIKKHLIHAAVYEGNIDLYNGEPPIYSEDI